MDLCLKGSDVQEFGLLTALGGYVLPKLPVFLSGRVSPPLNGKLLPSCFWDMLAHWFNTVYLCLLLTLLSVPSVQLQFTLLMVLQYGDKFTLTGITFLKSKALDFGSSSSGRR